MDRRPVLLFITVLSLALLLFLSVWVFRPAGAATPVLSLVAPNQSHPAGQPLDVTVVVADAEDLGAFAFDVHYDSSLLVLDGYSVSDFLGATANCNTRAGRCAFRLGPQIEAGVPRVGAYSYGDGPGPSGDGVVATLHFSTTGALGSATLRAANALTTDTGGDEVQPLVQDDTVTIVSTTTTPTATATSTVTPVATPRPTDDHAFFLPVLVRQ